MGRARLAGVAVAGSLALVGTAAAPAAVAVPSVGHAKPTPGKASPKPTKPPPPPPPPCVTPKSIPASKETAVPWAQDRLGFTDLWKTSTGKNVTVAVVDSGINAAHPQLRGRVAKHTDLTGTHDTDCYGHGTMVAGIIAGQDLRTAPKDPVPFVGVAPDVKLFSVKIQTGHDSNDHGELLAKGIRRAADMGPDIINISVQNTAFPALYSAVQYALRKHILIVAAAGNVDPKRKTTVQAAYPASYPGVLSVGALGRDGPVSSFSNSASRVDVSGPGDWIISTGGTGYIGGERVEGTSYSAPYVTGVAALIKSLHPELTPAEIIKRIASTADGGSGAGSGRGMINPTAALNATGNTKPTPGGSLPPAAALPVDIGGPPPIDHRTRDIGGVIAASTIGVALLVVFAGVVVPLGRRRGWRPGRAAALPSNSDERHELTLSLGRSSTNGTR